MDDKEKDTQQKKIVLGDMQELQTGSLLVIFLVHELERVMHLFLTR